MGNKNFKGSKTGISDKDTLSLMRMVHGGDVMCTNGLFHMFNKDHNEIYIDRVTAELDKRGLYKTLVVLDSVVVAKVVNSDKINFVILDKSDLKCLYKTNGNIYYIDENMVCDKKDDTCILISHEGKILAKLEDTQCVNHMLGNMYIANSDKMYKDKVLYYSKRKDELEDLTFGKEYLIHRLDKHGTEVEVISMEGGQYIYDFETRIVKNKFTGQEEKETSLWKVI